MKSNNERLYKMAFSRVYPLYVQKVERKGRNQAELDTVITWLTGYSEEALKDQIAAEVDLETFFSEAPQLNKNANQITGIICGVRVEDIEEPLMQQIRWMDKLVDEIAKGKQLEKILRD